MWIRKKRKSAARGDGQRQGMTLIEVIIAMAIFSVILLGFLNYQFSTLQADRVSTMQTSGTVALRGQMERSLASAYNNMKSKASIAKGLLSYYVEMSKKSDLGDVADVRLDDENKIIVHTFPVPVPGGSLGEDTANLYENAVGIFTVYLDEGSVPADEFLSWSTFKDDGSVVLNSDGFDMNGNRTTTDDFSSLFTGGPVAFAGSDLNCLPVKGEIRYYNTAIDYNTATDKAKKAYAYSVTRNFIINGDSFISNEIERDSTTSGPAPTIPE